MTKLLKINDLNSENIASICDHTFLYRSESFKKTVRENESCVSLRKELFLNFLNETINLKFSPHAICVRPEDVSFALNFLKEHDKEKILVASVVGFPDGSHYSTDFKIFETKLAIAAGAKEIDMVINYEKLKKGDFEFVCEEIKAVVFEAHKFDVLVKVILENSELIKEQIKKACELCEAANVDFVKTSTGFSSYGALVEDLNIMRKNFSKGVKASGGVNISNVKKILFSMSGRDDGFIDLNPLKVRIGESSLLIGLDDGY
ncbi:MAG: deoxyribose-phosphate aldolase [Nanoarchaeota archaeon]|nr:deoxyribose-phosphate aldolase [Nanoarchaeota archaeon]MBU1030054.1 deoxyribose-phosphate aldolase [Nanoarchaeota archaeon]MBU1850461.1 deoxyribose-phosphate aldolase [Nanoarchaeota archaeon]